LLNNQQTKYIGLDYGKKRTGISISDCDKAISFPYKTVETINLINFLKDLTKKEKIEKIIIGKPLKLNNQIHFLENEIGNLIKIIKNLFPNIAIHRIDERFTSKISIKILNQLDPKKKIRMDKTVIDKISASLILESYLNRITK